MKKIYSLFLLLCAASFSSIGQVTVNINATGLSTSYTTGSCTSTGVRSDGNIVAVGSPTATRGYAVFDLSTASIPAGSVITAVSLGYYATYTAGTIAGTSTNGYPGDLAPVTVPATLYAAMAPPLPTVSLSTVAYTAGTGHKVVASTAAQVSFVQANYTGKVSYAWTHTGTATFTITGETGTPSPTTGVALTTAGHAPWLQVTYCPPPTAVTATASPTTLCEGATLSLTGTATGATAYTWTGPGAYSGAGLSRTLPTTTSSSGVYTLTAVNVCGAFSASTTATTAAVTVNPLPAAIGGTLAACSGGGTTTLTDVSGPGTWTSSTPGVATINSSTGVATGVVAGTTTITYAITSTGCYITDVLTVNDAPAAITGPTTVCESGTITLSETSTGGAWSSASTGTATVGVGTGIVTGVAGGSTNIDYTIPGCPAATYAITVNPLPAPIVGSASVCDGLTTTFTNSTSGGSWSSSDLLVATVGTTGIVTGVNPGAADITYSLPSGCYVTKGITVNALPAAITGATSVCPGRNTTFADVTPGGNWTSSNALIASVSFVGGIVTGVAVGVADITYVMPTGCYAVKPITVYPLPAPITGTTTAICEGATTTLSDADFGGEWTSSNTALATIGSLTGDVTGILSGNPIFTYTMPTGCYVTHSLTVVPAPTAVITPLGPTTFCTGGSVVLSSSTGPGYLYQWENSGVPIAGETNNTYTATTTASFDVRVTNSFGCTTTSTLVAVSAAISPVITTPTPVTSFCFGENIILTANTGGTLGTILYQWQKDGVNILGATGPTFFATTTGSYVCEVTVSGGSGVCVVPTPPVNITAYALPVPPVSFTGVALVTLPTYVRYQWYANLVGVPGATSSSYIPAANGNYQVIVTDVHGCTGRSNPFIINNVGVTEVNQSAIRIYPNPATTKLTIEATNTVKVVITGMDGRVVLSNEAATQVDISSLANGLYLVMLYNEQGERLLVQKLIKE